MTELWRALNSLHTTARHFWEVRPRKPFCAGPLLSMVLIYQFRNRNKTSMAEANIQVRKHVSKVCFAACTRDSKNVQEYLFLPDVHDFDRRKQQFGFDRTLPPTCVLHKK
jgi:DNA/RNA endonuclease G (NUC1)